jgi:hypothetical protein
MEYIRNGVEVVGFSEGWIVRISLGWEFPKNLSRRMEV